MSKSTKLYTATRTYIFKVKIANSHSAVPADFPPLATSRVYQHNIYRGAVNTHASDRHSCFLFSVLRTASRWTRWRRPRRTRYRRRKVVTVRRPRSRDRSGTELRGRLVKASGRRRAKLRRPPTFDGVAGHRRRRRATRPTRSTASRWSTTTTSAAMTSSRPATRDVNSDVMTSITRGIWIVTSFYPLKRSVAPIALYKKKDSDIWRNAAWLSFKFFTIESRMTLTLTFRMGQGQM